MGHIVEEKFAEFRRSSLGQCFALISKPDRTKIVFATILQATLGLLDLIGVLLIGVLGALAVTGIQSKTPDNRVNTILEFLNLNNLSFQSQVAYLGLIAGFLLLGKTIFSVYFTRRMFYFLSHKSAKASSKLISQLFSQSFLSVQSNSSQKTLFSVTNGVTTIMLGVIGSCMTMFTDFALLVIMSLGLFYVDKIMALTTILLFALVGISLYGLLNKRAKRLGARQTALTIESNESILQAIETYREIIVHNRQGYYSEKIGKIRFRLGSLYAESNFLPYIGKYVIESVLVFGSLFLAAIQFILNDATQAVSILTVFMAAGSRIAPAALRIQQSSLVVRNSLSSAAPTIEFISHLGGIESEVIVEREFDTQYIGFDPKIEVSNVQFSYPESKISTVKIQSLTIESGSTVAFVGPTGAGKTTAIDLLIGILKPSMGKILISGISSEAALVRWPGAISYVPQEIIILNGSIKENVCLGYESFLFSDDDVWEALAAAQLESFIRGLPNQLETIVGERGTKLSGGQRQRLGIARALFTQPKLLVLDESTSSLDSDTEVQISEAIQALRGRVTVVMIAHRLSTVRSADLVVYMDQGEVLCTGSFEEVRAASPNFDRQARRMGLQ